MINLIYDPVIARGVKENCDKLFDEKYKEEMNPTKIKKQIFADILKISSCSLLAIVSLVFFILSLASTPAKHIITCVFCLALLFSLIFTVLFITKAFENKEERKRIEWAYRENRSDYEYPMLAKFYLGTNGKEIIGIKTGEKSWGTTRVTVTLKSENGDVDTVDFYFKEKFSTTVTEVTVDVATETILIPYKNDASDFKWERNAKATGPQTT